MSALLGYCAPTSIDEMLTELSAHKSAGKSSKILAGGTDLIVQMKSAPQSMDYILDVKKIPEANQLTINDKTVYLGASVPAWQITSNSSLKSLFPGLVESVEYIGSSQIQGRATVGGNLSNASPAGDTIPALIVNDAQCIICSPAGKRQIPVEDYVTGVQTNCLQPDEFLLAISLKCPAQLTADAYIRFTPRTEMDIAVVGVGVSLTLNQDSVCTAAQVALGAVSTKAIKVGAAEAFLLGSSLDEGFLQAAAQAASEAGAPISDKRGTALFRRKLAGVLLKRAVRLAQERIKKIK